MDVKRLMSQMQNQFAVTQKKLEALIVEASAGGEDGVFIKMRGTFQVVELIIKFMPTEKGDLEILSDLIQKAHSEAHAKIEAEIKKSTGGMF
jgi:DNA-binding protein YbaB